LVEVEDGSAVVLCDLCWFAAGGSTAVAGRAAAGEPLVVLDPVAENVLLSCSSADSGWRHALDSLLIDSGVSWPLLRQIRPAARVRLATLVAARTPPARTRRAIAQWEWLDAVDERIAARSGPVFRYRCKAVRWREICAVWAEVAERERRPLTRISQEEIAAAVGCSTKTVQRVEQWLQEEGLFWEVVPGCLIPQADVPEAETLAERAARHARQAAADEAAARVEAAHQALVAAELDALHAGLTGGDAAEAALAAIGPQLAADLAAVPPGDQETLLLRIVPVYELRVPLTPAELAEGDDLEAALANSPSIPLPRSTSTNTAGMDATDEFVYPPQSLGKEISSPAQDPVDNGRASRGSDKRGGHDSCPDQPEWGIVGPERVVDGSAARAEGAQASDDAGGAEGNWETAPHDPAVARAWLRLAEADPQLCEMVTDSWLTAVIRTSGLFTAAPSAPDPAQLDRETPNESTQDPQQVAAWLLRSSLDPRLCDTVTQPWLAALILASGLLDQHGWTREDLRDHLHGEPDYPRLPYHVRDPRGWIKARLCAAVPALPPSKQRQDHEPEHTGRSASGAEAAARRATITACALCDDNGLLDLGGDAPLVRCNHDVDTAGW
jgi:hypothetical protein